MKTEPGSRLGPYEILNLLGAGGMGEVWRARDTRLDRDVAIKVLPPALAQSSAFQLRFEREAKTISQLFGAPFRTSRAAHLPAGECRRKNQRHEAKEISNPATKSIGSD